MGGVSGSARLTIFLLNFVISAEVGRWGLPEQNRDCSRDSKNLEFMDGH
jgi:hypothetical protein